MSVVDIVGIVGQRLSDCRVANAPCNDVYFNILVIPPKTLVFGQWIFEFFKIGSSAGGTEVKIPGRTDAYAPSEE